MAILLLLLLAINWMPTCFTMQIGISTIANVIDSIVPKITQAIEEESEKMMSLAQFQSGNFINTPGEIADLPSVIFKTLDVLDRIKASLFELFQAIEEEYNGKYIAGPKITIPNVLIEPYLAMVPELHTIFSKFIFCFRNIGGIIQNDIIPLLTQTLQQNGNMLVPANVANAIMMNIEDVPNDLHLLATCLQNAVTQSENNHSSSESFMGTMVMNYVNNMFSQLPANINNVAQQLETTIAAFPIEQVTSTQDQTNVTEIVKLLNNYFNEENLFKQIRESLKTAKRLVDMAKSPLGAAFLNFL